MEEEELECPNSSSEKRYFPESLDSSDGDAEGVLTCEDLELNPFDGLPYSSRYYKLLKEREDLPVWKEKYSFMENLLQNQIVIVSGDAKCGKSSQVPQWCAEYCLSIHYQHGGVICTQVHKQTAVQLALRVADEMDVNIGHEVGYMIPFENCCTSETILRYCTDDMLQREMMSNPFLGSYGVIILDDIHERSIATDVLLGLLKDVLLARPELKLIINSSPLLISKLSSYYGNVPLIEVKNKHPVEVVYLSEAQKDSFESILRLIFEIHHSGEKGDIVVFLACEQDIEKAYEIVCQEGSSLNSDLGELVVFPLYPQEKCTLFKSIDDMEKGCQVYQRRVVLTTSSGESLIWSNTVKFVIDVGVERRKVYNPRIRANSLIMQPISQSQAEIRKQILGSSTSGKLFCLYTEEFASKDMRPLKPAEMQEANLTSMVLFMKRIDIAGLGHCDFMNRPAPESLMQALEDLDYLAALDNDGNLSEFGIIMSEFPLDPQLSKSILASCEFDCVDEMLIIAAMVTAPNCFSHLPHGAEDAALTCWKTFLHPEGDHFTLINIYKAYQNITLNSTSEHCVEKWCQDYFLNYSALRMADVIRAELLEIIKRIELPYAEPAFGTEENNLNIKKALLSGYFMQIARDVDGSGNYLMLTHKQVAQLHPLSSYSITKKMPEWVLFHQFSISENNFIRITSAVSPELFMQLVPQYYFSNLPPSESKDILQQVMDHLSSISSIKQEQTMCEKCPETTEQRCTIQ
ncbi:putative pre-mRNA-splicing factor ATP-dependent RNA helicase DHX32 [Octodon degus]|uniref:Putative pre-mRNA-splicing factor ATP-dependent RNA helicase DHX32 n=1 Tax=Octodon degus TaxID=10160 RepID=A0A6P3ETV0_OCTDE|nr:putative pre-mRNA-splicing factor ATP-dependent RNA helicase DHX32 [Octodon degus]XP_023564659.1 putative pre-mRNA-splicing factor ATP-dependent RNA helicase DHX32 [Octodon degus]